MVGSAGPVLVHRPAELRHRHYRDFILVSIQVLPKSRDTIPKVSHTPRKDAVIGPLVKMRVPSTGFRERHLETHIHLDQLGDLPHRAAQSDEFG
jgi:hypothetical protein